MECSRLTAADVFPVKAARAAVLVTEKGGSKKDLARVIGGELFAGHVDFLYACMDAYRGTEPYREYLRLLEESNQKKSGAQKRRPAQANTAKNANQQSGSSLPRDITIARNLANIDPALLQMEETSGTDGLGAPTIAGKALTKKQQAAEDKKKKTAIDQERRKNQKAIDEEKKKQDAKIKHEQNVKKKEDEKREKEAKAAKRKAEKEAKEATKGKKKKTTHFYQLPSVLS
ncbi:hypothetical protein PtA15_7A766 [Puccinia triticina]|nr:uncharacterized protein PtA15_7A766 [Puccinia triticina]WAQ87037.1 hypothetical protein PtA15_7A766 [Puccinia triticina]WAR56893.1 hypothetical protein PtB15_7B745 [Puccinia triticina]